MRAAAGPRATKDEQCSTHNDTFLFGTPVDGAFWSPWLGIESSDQLNLLQPVNPWMGSSWGAYVEYYQWQPTHNFDSNMFAVKAGDVMHGTAVYNAKDSTYTMGQSVVGGSAGQTVTVDLPIQTNSYGVPKNYTIVYLVMEKVWDCDQYSTDGQVTFYDIAVEIDGKPIENPKWITSYVEDNCNNRAKVLNSSAIQITWDQNM